MVIVFPEWRKHECRGAFRSIREDIEEILSGEVSQKPVISVEFSFEVDIVGDSLPCICFGYVLSIG